MIIIVARLRSQNSLGKAMLASQQQQQKMVSHVKKAMPHLLLWGPPILRAYTCGIYYVHC